LDRLSNQKINKETRALSDTLDQVIDIYRTFHPKTAEYLFFMSEHGTFSKIDHILGNKSLNTPIYEKKLSSIWV